MPTERYRSALDLPRVPRALDGALADRIEAAWQWAHAAGPADPPRGVQRFRSLAEAQQARRLRTRDRLRALRARRARGAP